MKSIAHKFIADCAEKLFVALTGYMTKTGLILWDSGGGGDTKQTTTTSNVPEYARPYYEDLLNRTGAVSSEGYMGYGGPRVAGANGYQQEAYRRIGSMGESGEMGQASGILGSAADRAFGSSNYQPGFIGSTYNPNEVQHYDAPDGVEGRFDAGQFDGAAAQQYMNPYADAVTNATVRQMDAREGQNRVARDGQAAQAGAFGGSRAALVQQDAANSHEAAVGDVIAKGRDEAYKNAQTQYERDRAARYQESQQDFGADQFNVDKSMQWGADGVKAGQFNESQRAQAALMAMQGQTSNEANRIAAAGVNQKGIGMAADIGTGMMNLGNTRQDMALERATALGQVGKEQQADQQKQYDVAYQDFVNQRDHERNNLAFYSSMLHGSTPQMNSDTIQTGGGGNQTAQMLGTGIAAYGALNGYGGTK